MTPRVEQALRAVGAVLKRQKKHRVYELPNGKNVVLPSTPSDGRHGEENSLTDIRKAAGVSKPKKVNRKTERREKQGRREADWSLKTNPLSVALTDSGLTEKLLRTRIVELEKSLVFWTSASSDVSNALYALESSRWHRLGKWLGVI